MELRAQKHRQNFFFRPYGCVLSQRPPRFPMLLRLGGGVAPIGAGRRKAAVRLGVLSGTTRCPAPSPLICGLPMLDRLAAERLPPASACRRIPLGGPRQSSVRPAAPGPRSTPSKAVRSPGLRAS
ncbi:unnamed protein product [Prorocentrum cordatum]|uniref:Uncharacterized protein n=1 Tax=Prorocentrum cordatum TaxID=2364126 RepID=A0ABN9SIG0_9DINO|nr:unnamed protein product [Polarella glacialis]